MKIKVSLIIIYALVFNQSCKSTTHNSNLQDVPTTETAYGAEESLELSPIAEASTKNLKKAFKELKLHDSIPMVVVSDSKPYIRKATAVEALGNVKDGEELFFGTPTSSYLVGMTGSIGKRPESTRGIDVTFSLKSYDIKSFHRDRKLKLVDGYNFVIKSPHIIDVQALKDEISSHMRGVKNFLSKPEFAADMKGLQRALESRRSAEFKRNRIGNQVYAHEMLQLGIFLMYGVLLLPTLLPLSMLDSTITSPKVKLRALITLAGVALVMVIYHYFIVPWLWERVGIDIRSLKGINQEIEDADKIVDEFRKKYESTDTSGSYRYESGR